jgi:folate-binding Fe-S cluster repair protein YgfZ
MSVEITESVRTASPLLARPGAVAGDPPDEAVAAHYGDPLREQTLPAGLVDRSHRDVLTVSGPDRLSWLHTLTSQHLSELAPGVGIEALILSPNGHVEHHLSLVDDGETTWIDVEGGTADALISYLERMRPR